MLQKSVLQKFYEFPSQKVGSDRIKGFPAASVVYMDISSILLSRSFSSY